MHICFVSFDYPSQTTGGGVGTQVQLLAHGFAESGQQVSVIAFGNAKEESISKDHDVLIWRLPPSNLHWYVSKIPLIGKFLPSFVRELERSWAAWQMLRKIDRQKKVDAVEIIETGGLFISLLETKKLVCIRLHGEQYTFRKYTPTLPLTLDVRLGRLLQRISIRHSGLKISPSHAHAHEITIETGLPENEIICLPNVIHPRDDFSKAQTHGKKNILFVGRLEHVKAVPLLLEAFSMLTRQIPDVQLILAGAQHPTLSQPAIEEIVSKNKLQHSIHILGHVPHFRLSEWFSKARVLVLPSYYESFGLAALEAMACGIPVVAARVGGLPELIEDGVSGLLFDPGNVQDLASQLTKLLNDDRLRNRLARTARQHSLKKYNAASIIQKNLDLYQRLLNEEATSRAHVFFSPHFDDVVLSCGGLARELSRMDDVQVITVFAGIPPAENIGTFSRHMHTKWSLPDSKAVSLRQNEDQNAIEQLSVYIQTIHWNHLEAVYREDTPKRNLYTSYQALRSPPAKQDEELLKEIIRDIENFCNGQASQILQLYFPLGLGGHVDHQLLFKAGQELAKKGWQVHYYEDWPYVEDYCTTYQTQAWHATLHPISLSAKISAAQAYTSQIKGLGGDKHRLHRRLQHFAHQTGDRFHPVERTWQTSQPGTLPPFDPSLHRWKIGDFSAFYRSLGWSDLPEFLPPGRGLCLDAGSGNGRHKQTIEERGFTWLGLDLANWPNQHTQASLTHLPFSKNSVEAVVLWQVLEYLPKPHQAITEAIRILKPGGLICGSVSFLEPVHGRTFYGISQHALQELMESQGLEDIKIQPGISGFSLLLWTWLRRIGGDGLSRIAIPLIQGFFVPPAASIFIVSWLQWRFGRGGGHFMDWLTIRAPLEFAGHIHFTARKIY